MKKLTKSLLSFILIISMAFNFSVPAFAAENEDMLTNTFIEDDEDIQDNEYVQNDEYILIDAIETPYGTAYYVQSNDGIQTAAIWDLVDIIMAGKSWADLFSEPSLANFGWAVLDTAALLPVLPSSAYFRQGGKVLLKSDEVAKFAKTARGKTAVKAAMKTFKYSDGITQKAVKAIKRKFKGSEGEKVLKLFQDAANNGLVGAKNMAGIKKINPSDKIGKQYTHEIKILTSQYADYRILGYKTNTGTWVFDLFDKGSLHK